MGLLNNGNPILPKRGLQHLSDSSQALTGENMSGLIKLSGALRMTAT